MEVSQITIRPSLTVPVEGKYCAGCRFLLYGQCILFSIRIKLDQSRKYYSPIRTDQCIDSE